MQTGIPVLSDALPPVRPSGLSGLEPHDPNHLRTRISKRVTLQPRMAQVSTGAAATRALQGLRLNAGSAKTY